MTPSTYQQNIHEWLRSQETKYRTTPFKRDSLQVNALAGSGKTTLCIQSIDLLDTFGVSSVYAVFNAAAETEMQSRCTSKNCTIKTAHKLGLAALRSVIRTQFKIDGKKVSSILWNMKLSRADRDSIPSLCRLVSFAKNSGIGLPGSSTFDEDEDVKWFDIVDRFDFEFDNVEYSVQLAKQAMRLSNEDLTIIDFDDMLYLPLLLNASFPTFDYVFVDEAQDTNFVRREVYKRLRKPWGAFFIVGDKHQAIYGFTGADANALDIFANECNAHRLPLNVCWRCDREIIKKAQQFVPAIEWREDAGEGKVQKLRYASLLGHDSRVLTPDCAILCRFNAPIASLAMHLLTRGVPCRIEGREFGAALVKIFDRAIADLGPDKKLLNVLQDQLALDLAKAKTYVKQDAVQDTYNSLFAVLSYCRSKGFSFDDAATFITSMFVDSSKEKKAVLTLSSIHKSKGKEWPTVYLLGPDSFMPSPRATQPWEIEQEKNLHYVAITRAKHTLIEVVEVTRD